MKTATITELKNGLSSFIDRVREGKSILILDRGIPVARLEPVKSAADPSGRLLRLQRAGLVEAGRAPAPLEMLGTPGPRLVGRASAVKAVLDERREGR